MKMSAANLTRVLSFQRHSLNVGFSSSISVLKRGLCVGSSYPDADEVVLKPISASVTRNLESHGPDFNFQPGHQHHQHGMSQGGHGHSNGGVQKGYLLNGSRTVMGQRPPAAKTVMEQRDNRR